MPGEGDVQEGAFYRFINRNYDLKSKDNAFLAAALSGSQMVMFKGRNPLPNFSRSSDFAFRGSDEASAKLLGESPVGNNKGSGLLGLYGSTAASPEKIYRPLVYETGELLGATMTTLQNAISAGDYQPTNGAEYPGGTFGRRLTEAAMLFKRTPVKFIGLNIGGWDTHAGQGQLYGRHGDLLTNLSTGIQALSRDLADQWEDMVVLTMTEFGRTSAENGSRGTDHAEASVMFAAGGPIKGGVYNCDADSWNEGAMFERRGRYLSRRTDFRSVMGEVFVNHFGESAQGLSEIFPGYEEAQADTPGDFAPLNFVRG